MSQLAIKVENLSKAYELGQIGTGTISRDIERWYARVRGKEDPFIKIGETGQPAGRSNEIVWSLKDINFEIEQGDAVGIIGRNGAGKSTLLKILSKVTSPTTGKITGKGRVASLLEVGTGFHPELSGRENIFLNGAILGMRKKEIQRKLAEIVDFAEIERYLDTPVKRYSSGMYVRLAFAVAAHLESEILIVDEVLAVGDAEFQKKCLGKMNEVSKGEGRTVLFVSHNMGSVLDLCTKGIYLKDGYAVNQGSIDQIISAYANHRTHSNNYKSNPPSAIAGNIFIDEITLQDANGQVRNDFFLNENIHLKFKLFPLVNASPDLFVIILDARKRRVFACEANGLTQNMEIIINSDQLVRGNYSLQVLINVPNVAQLELIEDTCDFSVIDLSSKMSKHGNYDYGNVLGRYQVIKS